MNIKLVTLSVVGLAASTAAIAAAAPAQVDLYRAPWVTLSAGDKIHADGRTTIELGKTQPMKRLELQATRGRTTVNEVAIKFANGGTERVKEGVTLERGGKLEIKLDGYRGRDITAVRVFGASSPHGMFELLGKA